MPTTQEDVLDATSGQSEAATANTDADRSPSDTETETGKTPLRDQPIEQQLEVQREISRKQEKRAKENLRMYEQARAELASANTTIALYQLRRDHPQFTDEDIAACTETDPEAIKRWGDTLQQVIDRHIPAAGAPEPAPSPAASITPDLDRVVAGINEPTAPKTDAESPEQLYKYFREKYERRK